MTARPRILLLLLLLVLLPFASFAKLQIVHAGLGRTGSSSLNEALAILGHNVTVGIPEMFQEYMQEFKELETGSLDARGFLDRMDAKGYTAVGYDMEPTELWRPAAKLGLKIILTERDNAQVWATSVLNTVATHGEIFSSRPFIFFEMFRVGKYYLEETITKYNDGEATKVIRDRERLERTYEKHSRAVKAAVPENNLLVFNVKQGWPPLCEYLEVASCPTTPFPWVMTSTEMIIITLIARTLTWVWPLLPFIALLLIRLLAWGVRWIVRRCSGGARGDTKHGHEKQT